VHFAAKGSRRIQPGLERESHGYLRPLGRRPFLPHLESSFLCLRLVAVPPFLPMHLGHTSVVRGCCGQYAFLVIP
jgi:hypothetical protein